MNAVTDAGNDADETPVGRKRLERQRTWAVVLAVAGIVLTVVNGYVTDDPNIVTPLMVVVGTAWFVVTHARIRALARSVG